MNDKIKELAEQAGFKLIRENCYDIVSTMSVQEFAQLIVRACAKFLEENSGYDDSNNAWHPEPEDLLKHFGVEE